MKTTIRVLGPASVAAAAAVLLMGSGAAVKAQTFDMKIGFVTINDSQHKSASWLAKELPKRTNGRIKPRVFPAAQLGTIPREIEGLQLGTQEAFITPPGFFQGINPAFGAADAPGLFDGFLHQHRALNHPLVRAKFLSLADRAGIVGAYITSAGEAAIASTRPIHKLDDMKGLKVRVLATKIEIGVAAEFGMTGVPMNYSEVVPALQQHTLDAAQSAIVVMGPSKFYTVAPYITLTRSYYIPSGLWLSKMWLNKLPSDLRTTLFETAREASEHAVHWSIEITRHWEKEWAKQPGAEVIRLSDAQQKELFRRARPLGDKILGGDPKIKPMYDLIKQAAELTREKKS